MANGFSKSQMIFFEKVIEGFNNANLTARNCDVFSPSMQDVEHSGLTIRRPVPMIGEVTTGRDVTGTYKDITELTVPMTLADGDVLNHPFTLNAQELNDSARRDKAAKAAAQALSTKIDTLVSDKVSLFGSLVCTETSDFTDYSHLAKGATALAEREVNVSEERALALNPSMARMMANALAARTPGGTDVVMNAYERSVLPSVAGFETLQSNVITSLTGAADPVTAVSGANQRKTPTVFDGTNSSAADNRYMTLVVSDNLMANGDAFTIAGVNSVGMISKKDTGRLQTFRVISGGGTANLVISPAIIPVDQAASAFKKYGNVTTTPADTAAITRLNSATKSPSIFWVKRAVTLFQGKFAIDDLGPTVAVTREVTDSGIELIFARQGSIDDLSAKYRLTCWVSANVLEPQMAGIYLPNQATAFG